MGFEGVVSLIDYLLDKRLQNSSQIHQLKFVLWDELGATGEILSNLGRL